MAKVGRKKLPADQKLTERVRLYGTPAEYRAWQQAAAERGETLNHVLRKHLSRISKKFR